MTSVFALAIALFLLVYLVVALLAAARGPTPADRMLMAWGVEGRVPFLDHRLVEFGLGLPDALKIQGRNGKRFLYGVF